MKKAVKNNDIVAVEQILKKQPNRVNVWTRPRKKTPLFIACENGFLDIVKVLLAHKNTDVNLAEINGWTPLHIALANKHVEIVKELLKHPLIDTNCSTHFGGRAIWFCNDKTFDLVLKHNGFDINHKNRHGKTALQQTYEFAHINTIHKIEILLSNGADCINWRQWKFKKFATNQDQVISIMSKWRSYIPKWNIFNHKKFYPKEFKDLAITCMIVWNRVEIMHSIKICKDIKRFLVKYVAYNWRKKVDKY